MEDLHISPFISLLFRFVLPKNALFSNMVRDKCHGGPYSIWTLQCFLNNSQHSRLSGSHDGEYGASILPRFSDEHPTQDQQLPSQEGLSNTPPGGTWANQAGAMASVLPQSGDPVKTASSSPSRPRHDQPNINSSSLIDEIKLISQTVDTPQMPQRHATRFRRHGLGSLWNPF
jgi:hypothetical protein